MLVLKKTKCTLDQIVQLCEEVKIAHENLVYCMPAEEVEKQNIWFSAKMLVENGFIADVESWLKTNLVDVGDNDDDEHDVDEEVHPDDSVSNVASKNSQGKSISSSKHSHHSAKSTASSRIKAEAEKAALLARAAALKEKHALEAQEEQKKERATGDGC